jgi:S-adenosylhomocysteine hydrolase
MAGHDVADLSLAPLGRQRIEWADRDAGRVGRLPRDAGRRGPPLGDVFITATGDIDVIRPEVREFEMADGRRIQRVHPMPRPIDEEIAAVKLATLGVEIDAMTAGQARCLASWDRGT